MKKKSFLLLLLIAVAAHLPARSQQTAVYDDPDASYRQALNLFEKEKYGAAKEMFLEVTGQISDPKDELYASASLYAAICATELFNPDAESMLMEYMNNHSSHHGQKLAWFNMGNIKYRDRDYEDAVEWYGRLASRDIPEGMRTEFIFRKAYSYFMTESYNFALQLFGQITDAGSGYYIPARYYYGHSAYLTGHYDDAMNAFMQLTGDRMFGPAVPYYIVHIYYLQERFTELLEHAPELLEEASPQRSAEISRLIGEAYYNQEEYLEAIPHLEDYINHFRGAAGRDDHYQLGYSLYMNNRFEEAIPHLERAVRDDDELAQNASYHLASAYIQTGQKRFARNAFMQAHQIGINEEIARESLFNYAKLSFELSYDPHNEAILSFQRYINQYPSSPRTEEAYAYLADLYLTTRNYKDALESLEQIPHNTSRLREAYQRVSFYRGAELFNNNDLREAISHFEKTQRYNDSPTMYSASLFWNGEAFYRLGNYDNAISMLERFLSAQGARSLDYYSQAHYSLGYSHFKKEQYSNAISAFRRFMDEGSSEERMLNDAVLRLADSYFITMQYQIAMDHYNRAVSMGVIDTDYAVFQKGLVYGITGMFTEKINTLQSLIRDYPSSSYLDDSKYEIANTWLLLNNNAQARNYFARVIDEHPASSYAQSAKLKTGLIHYNENEDERALEIFRRVVESYPGTAEAEEALSAMRNIYVDLDRVDEFVRFTEGMGIADLSRAEEDSLVYQAAENRYMQGDCEGAVTSFNNYLDRFPDGVFALNAHFYRSECLFRANEHQRALEGYRFVIDSQRSMFLENSLLRASSIEFAMGNYEDALLYFSRLAQMAEYPNNRLVARTGRMRSLHRLERHAEAVEAAREVLTEDRLSQDQQQEAHHIKGLSAMAMQDTGLAREAFKSVKDIITNRRSAEAMYNMALITFREGDYEAAEEEIFEYINSLSAYDYWLARTFLLLSDVYIESGNTFQARHTLESIIENYEGEEIVTEALGRIEFIDRQEEEESASTGNDEE